MITSLLPCPWLLLLNHCKVPIGTKCNVNAHYQTIQCAMEDNSLLQFEDDESVNDESVNDEYFVEPENETCDDDSEW